MERAMAIVEMIKARTNHVVVFILIDSLTPLVRISLVISLLKPSNCHVIHRIGGASRDWQSWNHGNHGNHVIDHDVWTDLHR